MLDIRKQIKKVIETYGHTVIYVRTDPRFRCECYSEHNGESTDSNCKKCFGTGFKSSVEKVRTRRKPLAMPETLVAVRKAAGMGNIAVAGYTYYMEHDFNPKSGDFIFEVEWHKGEPVRVKEKLKISFADPKEGLHGRTEFFQVYSRTHWQGDGDIDGINED